MLKKIWGFKMSNVGNILSRTCPMMNMHIFNFSASYVEYTTKLNSFIALTIPIQDMYDVYFCHMPPGDITCITILMKSECGARFAHPISGVCPASHRLLLCHFEFYIFS